MCAGVLLNKDLLLLIPSTRLFSQDAGYGEKSLFAPEDDNEEETQMKIDDEVGSRFFGVKFLGLIITSRQHVGLPQGDNSIQHV